MKKLFPLAVIAMFAALTFSSCKKDSDHTCTCHIIVIADSLTLKDTTLSYSLGKQSSGDAQSACNNYQTNEQQQMDSGLTQNHIPDSDGHITCHI